jgi:hypothetical protein
MVSQTLSVNSPLTTSRYAFDVIGELFFGQMFGFMENREDHQSYIASLAILIPILATLGVAPSYIRPLILLSSAVSSQVRRGLVALKHIGEATRDCVDQHLADLSDGQKTVRRDMVQQLLDLTEREKRGTIEFGVEEVKMDCYSAL